MSLEFYLSHFMVRNPGVIVSEIAKKIFKDLIQYKICVLCDRVSSLSGFEGDLA